MSKPPKKSVMAGIRSKPSRLRELSGSAALIGALQAQMSDPVLKALLSCFAPAIVEACLHVYDAQISRWLVYVDRRDKARARKQDERDQADRLLSAETKLKEALADPHLSEDDKQQLKETFAKGKKALVQKAMTDVFPEEDATAVSTGSFQGSAAG